MCVQPKEQRWCCQADGYRQSPVVAGKPHDWYCTASLLFPNANYSNNNLETELYTRKLAFHNLTPVHFVYVHVHKISFTCDLLMAAMGKELHWGDSEQSRLSLLVFLDFCFSRWSTGLLTESPISPGHTGSGFRVRRCVEKKTSDDAWGRRSQLVGNRRQW